MKIGCLYSHSSIPYMHIPLYIWSLVTKRESERILINCLSTFVTIIMLEQLYPTVRERNIMARKKGNVTNWTTERRTRDRSTACNWFQRSLIISVWLTWAAFFHRRIDFDQKMEMGVRLDWRRRWRWLVSILRSTAIFNRLLNWPERLLLDLSPSRETKLLLKNGVSAFLTSGM
jgi:hypothetical protein